MACFESNNEGQYPVLCQICEEEEKLIWKCLDCEMMMCIKCKEKIHPKFKFAGDHRIINIKEVGVENQGNETEKSTDVSNIKCIQHPPQVLTLYCELCDQLVCASCIVQMHKKHDLLEICDGYEKRLERLRDSIHKIQTKKDNLSKEIRKLEEMKIIKESQYNEVIRKILTHENELADAVQTQSKIIKSDLEKRYQSIQKSIDQEIDHIHEMEKDATDTILKLESQIDKSDASDIFKNLHVEENIFMECKLSLNSTNMTLPQFVPREINLTDIGALQTETDKMVETKSEDSSSSSSTTNVDTMTKTEETGSVNSLLKVVNEYDTEHLCITKITVCHDGLLWIVFDSNVLQKVRLSDQGIEVVSSYNAIVKSMTLTSKNHLLFTTNEYKIFIIYSDTGKMQHLRSKYSKAPFQPLHIHVSADDYVYVGVTINYTVRSVHYASQGVLVMDLPGNIVDVIYQNSTTVPLLTNIIDLNSTNGTVVLIDGLHGINVGFRVLTIGNTGNINTYDGHLGINTKNMPFAQFKIAIAPSKNIVVYDTSTHALHILNSNAQLLTHIYLYKTGIPVQTMESMNFSTDSLYVGLLTHYSSSYAILYHLDISGCPELTKCTDKQL